MLIGRFLFGFSTGLFSSTVPRYIEETIPTHLYDTLGPIYTFSQNVGTLAAYLLGELLPDEKATAALKASEVWRVFYFYFPAAMYIVVLLALLFTIKHDSVKNLVTKNRRAEARAHLCLVYKRCNE